MHQVLIDLGGFKIYTYGALLATAFFLANQWGLYLARRLGYSLAAVEESIMWCILLGVAGCRLGFVLVYPDEYIKYPLQIFNLRQGGLTIMGGVLFVIAYQWFRCRAKGKSVMDLYDFWAGPLLVGMAFGRLGCLAHGCCFGAMTDLPWGITYPPGVLQVPGAGFLAPGPRHPSQMYEMLLDLGLLVIITKQLFNLKFAGQNFYTFMLGYGVIRFLDEMTREKETLFGPFTIYQWVSIAMAVIGLLGLLGAFGKKAVDREIFPRDGAANGPPAAGSDALPT
jgi:phosphatidylglycerol:prolipoprotein diacylglycerol transferase